MFSSVLAFAGLIVGAVWCVLMFAVAERSLRLMRSAQLNRAYILAKDLQNTAKVAVFMAVLSFAIFSASGVYLFG